MFVPILLLLAAAVLGWLTELDRMSPVALAVVEVESKLGFPLWPAFAAVGGVLLVLRLLHARPKAAPSPPRPITRDRNFGGATPRGPAPTPGNEWLVGIRLQARGVSDDAMGRVKFDEAQGIPFTLVLTAVTPEQARRRMAAYAAWLATIPTPPAARVRLVSSPDIEGPLHGLFRGELARHFPAEAFSVVSLHEGADVLFNQPDARWMTPSP